MRLTVLVLNLFVLSCHSEPLFGSLRALRERSKHLKEAVQVVQEGKRSASIKFTPKTDFLYPGLDQTKMEKIRNLWEEYYSCQRSLFEANQRLVVPEAIAFLEGSNAVLECEVCVSPRDIFNPTQWFYSADYDMNKLTVIRDSSLIFMKNESLYIYNIEDARTGLYVCKKGLHTARPYIVNVFSKEKTITVVPERNKEGTHAAPDMAVPELNATLTTVWSEWTKCSRCDLTGKKFRTGICTLVANKNVQGFRTKRKVYLPSVLIRAIATNKTKSKNSLVKGGQKNQSNEETTASRFSNKEMTVSRFSNQETTVSQFSSTKKNIPETKEEDLVKPINETAQAPSIAVNLTVKTDLELLDMFEDGIPCRSRMLSEYTRGLGMVENRSSEVMVAFCKLSCPKSMLFVVVDDQGNILETANNSEGVYSIKQGLPKEFPAISRTVEFAIYKKPFQIQCPGNRNGDIPTEWYVGRKILTNRMLQAETQGRIKIDAYNRIIFQSVLYEDSRVFSCWQRKELVGTVRLLVNKEHYLLTFQRPVTVIGTIIIFATFGYVYYTAFTMS